MKSLKFKLSPIEGEVLEGSAQKIFVKDSHTVLTILENHAPLVSTLSKGQVDIYPSEGEKQSYSFEQGFLRTQDNLCSITLLQ